MKTETRELVVANPRTWKSGAISMGAEPHGKCRNCGGAIWWGQIRFKSQPKPSWIAYSEAGHGGGGCMVMEKHDCNNPLHRATQ